MNERTRAAGSAHAIPHALSFQPPLAWDALLAFLAPRTIAGVEQVSAGSYARVVQVDDSVGVLRVSLDTAHASAPCLAVHIDSALASHRDGILARLHHVFDLHAEPNQVDGHLGVDRHFEDAVVEQPGVRVPGAFDGFELAWRAVLGQQVSVAGATTLAGRLAAAFGSKTETSDGALTHVSPTAERLARATVARIAKIGLPQKRAATIRSVAQLAVSAPDIFAPLSAESSTTAPTRRFDAARDALLALPGIGPWTARYIAMRVHRDADAFPESDLGLKKALGLTAPAAVLKRAERWRPYRAYAAMRLWASL